MARPKREILEHKGNIRVLFEEKCICGEHYEIEEENEDYATCKQCLRVYRPIEMVVPEGIVTMWGIYFDPYLEKSLVGRFMKACGVKNLPYSKKEQIDGW